MGEFEKLAKALYEGDVVASDLKILAGTNPHVSRDELAKALFDSLTRVGLIVDGTLVNDIKPKS